MGKVRLLIAGCVASICALAPATASAATQTFSAAGPVNVPGVGNDGPAGTYPWEIFVGGMPGNTDDIDVSLTGVAASRVSDIDALLVGPNNAGASLFMSDIGDATPIPAPGVDLTFDDAAGANAPIGSPLASGTYRPTNGDGADPDAFPAPAPGGAYSSTLASLNGVSPNGTWRLFLVDDDGVGVDPGVGSVVGWSLRVTSTAAPSSPTNTTKPKKPKKSKRKKSKGSSSVRRCPRRGTRRYKRLKRKCKRRGARFSRKRCRCVRRKR